MRQAEKQPVFGPPESMREHVVAASRAMKTGDWNACMNFLINEKMNSKVSKDHFVHLLRKREREKQTSILQWISTEKSQFDMTLIDEP